MEVSKLNQKLSAFLESGIFRFEDSDSVFIDPVRVLNQLYTRFMVSPSSYYSRFFESSDETHQQSSNSRKRKRKEKKPYTLNERERAADWRHRVKIFYTIPCLVNGDSELRTIVASISLWLTTTGEWKCPPEVEVVDSDNRSRIKIIPDNRLVSSIPGDYSRKPPIGGLLKEYSSGHGPTRCLELFAREMVSGSVSWGNEPLDFQDSRYLYECRDGQYIYTKALFFGRHF